MTEIPTNGIDIAFLNIWMTETWKQHGMRPMRLPSVQGHNALPQGYGLPAVREVLERVGEVASLLLHDTWHVTCYILHHIDIHVNSCYYLSEQVFQLRHVQGESAGRIHRTFTANQVLNRKVFTVYILLFREALKKLGNFPKPLDRGGNVARYLCDALWWDMVAEWPNA